MSDYVEINMCTCIPSTGGWDKHVKCFDPREDKCVASYALPGKVYSMDLVDNSLVVGMSERHVHIFDVRYMDRPQQVKCKLFFYFHSFTHLSNSNLLSLLRFETRR